MDLAVNLADTTSRYFQETWAPWPEPIKIVFIRKCPKLLRICGISIWNVLSGHSDGYSDTCGNNSKINKTYQIHYKSYYLYCDITFSLKCLQIMLLLADPLHIIALGGLFGSFLSTVSFPVLLCLIVWVSSHMILFVFRLLWFSL